MAFTVTMEKPSGHYYHVTLRCEGIKEPTINFKLPAWTPGYYQLLNFAKNVENFKALDAAGNDIACNKPALTAGRYKVPKLIQ